jgi:hypothetical protein
MLLILWHFTGMSFFLAGSFWLWKLAVGSGNSPENIELWSLSWNQLDVLKYRVDKEVNRRVQNAGAERKQQQKCSTRTDVVTSTSTELVKREVAVQTRVQNGNLLE